ncbi:hypothetical protein FRC18_011866 [Serendipita sp. 400]|nr:hypothetical protein FRC18_011866 [Serendipita sp. 400]
MRTTPTVRTDRQARFKVFGHYRPARTAHIPSSIARTRHLSEFVGFIQEREGQRVPKSSSNSTFVNCKHVFIICQELEIRGSLEGLSFLMMEK